MPAHGVPVRASEGPMRPGWEGQRKRSPEGKEAERAAGQQAGDDEGPLRAPMRLAQEQRQAQRDLDCALRRRRTVVQRRVAARREDTLRARRPASGGFRVARRAPGLCRAPGGRLARAVRRAFRAVAAREGAAHHHRAAGGHARGAPDPRDLPAGPARYSLRASCDALLGHAGASVSGGRLRRRADAPHPGARRDSRRRCGVRWGEPARRRSGAQRVRLGGGDGRGCSSFRDAAWIAGPSGGGLRLPPYFHAERRRARLETVSDAGAGGARGRQDDVDGGVHHDGRLAQRGLQSSGGGAHEGDVRGGCRAARPRPVQDRRPPGRRTRRLRRGQHVGLPRAILGAPVARAVRAIPKRPGGGGSLHRARHGYARDAQRGSCPEAAMRLAGAAPRFYGPAPLQ